MPSCLEAARGEVYLVDNRERIIDQIARDAGTTIVADALNHRTSFSLVTIVFRREKSTVHVFSPNSLI